MTDKTIRWPFESLNLPRIFQSFTKTKNWNSNISCIFIIVAALALVLLPLTVTCYNLPKLPKNIYIFSWSYIIGTGDVTRTTLTLRGDIRFTPVADLVIVEKNDTR